MIAAVGVTVDESVLVIVSSLKRSSGRIAVRTCSGTRAMAVCGMVFTSGRLDCGGETLVVVVDSGLEQNVRTASCDSLAAAAGATMPVAAGLTASLTLRAATRLLSRLVRHDCGGGCD